MSEEVAVPLAVEEPLVATPAPEAPAEVVTDQNPTESAPEASPGEEKPATAPEPDKPDEKKSHSRFERKISRLYREAAEQKARADLLEQQLNEAKPKSPDSGEPRMEQFDDIEKYAEAKAEYRKTQAFKEFETKQRTHAQQAAQLRLQTEWESKVAKAESKYEDFDEVVGELKPTTPWAVAIMKAENGDDVAHYLGTNVKEAQRIVSLDPVDQFIEIGKLSAKLQLQPVTPKTPSKAPAPITPLGGKSSGASDVPLDTDDINTWMKKENARMKKAAS